MICDYEGAELKQTLFYSGKMRYYYTMNRGFIMTIEIVQVADIPLGHIIH